MNSINNLSQEDRNKKDAAQRGKKFRLYFVQGIKAIIKAPWKIAFPILLGIAAFISWNKKDAIVSLIPLDIAALPDFLGQLLTYGMYTLLIVLYVLMFSLLLKGMGTPRQAGRVNRGVEKIFKNSAGYGDQPIYISCERVGASEVFRHEFFSEFVSRDAWEDKKDDVARLWRGHAKSVEYGGTHGNDPRYIVLYAGSGATEVDRGDFYDDQL
ncbi:MAG: hypothetical protein ACOYJB_08105 [Christensenellaceae bacterium]